MIPGMHRFHGHASLGQVYKQGQVVRGSQLTLKYTVNQRRRRYRAAVVVSRKVDKSAVVRNRIRRRIYEIVRQELLGVQQPFDLVFTVFNAQLADMPAPELQQLVSSQLEKAGAVPSVSPAPRAIVKAKDTE
jgi:ribonuclease P protein component